MTPDRIAYLAGYFEARGSIIARAGTVQARGKRRQMDGFGVSTSGPDSLVEALIATFGGARQSGRGWRCASGNAARFLATILPHLRHRRDEVEAALDFYRFMRAHPRKGSSRSVPSAITSERDRLAQRVADLRDTRQGYSRRRRLHLEMREGVA